jgi:hypothetical protein
MIRIVPWTTHSSKADRAQETPEGTVCASLLLLATGGIREWRSTVDEDGHYVFAVAL